MERALEKYILVLKQNNLSVTSPRKAVFEFLYSFGIQSMRQLIDRCASYDRASIYRTVKLLESIEVVNRIPQGFKYKVELSEIFLPHHHHIVCMKCGKSSDLEQTNLEQLLVSMASTENYKLVSHKVELQGLCSKCG